MERAFRSGRKPLPPRLRRRILDRDGWRCTRCGAAGQLEVHHRHEVRDGGTDDPANLETLCKQCHIDHHRPPVAPDVAAWQRLVRGTR